MNKKAKNQRRVMRIKMRRAATMVYLRAASNIAPDITNSCHSTCTLAHVSRPVNPTATMLSGSGSSTRSFHLIFNLGFPFFAFHSSSLLPFSVGSPSFCLFLSSSPFCAQIRNCFGFGDWGFRRVVEIDGKFKQLGLGRGRIGGKGLDLEGKIGGDCGGGDVNPNIGFKFQWLPIKDSS